jgi:hypothetical protein
MSKQGFTVWTAMIREDLYKISNAEVRKKALKLLTVVECAGFCLDRAPEARESFILPNLKPLIEYLKDDAVKMTQKAPEVNVTVAAPLPVTVPVVPVAVVTVNADEAINPS